MGQAASSPTPVASSSKPAECPMHKQEQRKPAECPMHESKPAACPIDHTSLSSRNQMPELAQTPAVNQTIELPTSRVESSIPRDTSAKWEYPSPQQFYNALVRKGWETPEEHIETMVDIHNFLNEQAWQEVLKWEKRADTNPEDIQLARFMGKPGQLSPKARILLAAGWLFPSHFNNEAPFDRHDWVVRRPESGEEVRYVIDYYSAPPEPDGSPVFSLDVRPALDSFGSIKQRISVATEDAWSTLREGKRA